MVWMPKRSKCRTRCGGSQGRSPSGWMRGAPVTGEGLLLEPELEPELELEPEHEPFQRVKEPPLALRRWREGP